MSKARKLSKPSKQQMDHHWPIEFWIENGKMLVKMPTNIPTAEKERIIKQLQQAATTFRGIEALPPSSVL